MSDPGPPVLELSSVASGYGGRRVLDGVNLSVGQGEFVALVGPNGSGKSTLLRTLLGSVPLAGGSTSLFGAAPSELRDRWRLGYVAQRVVVDEQFPGTVEEVVTSGRLTRRGWFRRLGAADRAAVDHALEVVAMEDRRTSRVRELSGGQQQRVFIAKALASEPQLLILDEPIAGVDVESQKRFRDSLVRFRDTGGSILLVSHELGAVADDLDRVVVLRHGKIEFDGPTSELMAQGVSLGVHGSDLPLWLEGFH